MDVKSDYLLCLLTAQTVFQHHNMTRIPHGKAQIVYSNSLEGKAYVPGRRKMAIMDADRGPTRFLELNEGREESDAGRDADGEGHEGSDAGSEGSLEFPQNLLVLNGYLSSMEPSVDAAGVGAVSASVRARGPKVERELRLAQGDC